MGTGKGLTDSLSGLVPCRTTGTQRKDRMKSAAIILALAVFAAACANDGGDAEVLPAASATTIATPTTTTTTTITPTTTTTTPTTTTAAATTTAAPPVSTAPVVLGEDPDVDAIVAAYSVVFDSATSYEEKAAFLTDAVGLEDTVAGYEATGESLGGVTLEAKEVGIAGDEALVLYDFLFGGNPAYSGLEGDAVRTDDGWKVTRDMFCRIMDLARVGCP